MDGHHDTRYPLMFAAWKFRDANINDEGILEIVCHALSDSLLPSALSRDELQRLMAEGIQGMANAESALDSVERLGLLPEYDGSVTEVLGEHVPALEGLSAPHRLGGLIFPCLQGKQADGGATIPIPRGARAYYLPDAPLEDFPLALPGDVGSYGYVPIHVAHDEYFYAPEAHHVFRVVWFFGFALAATPERPPLPDYFTQQISDLFSNGMLPDNDRELYSQAYLNSKYLTALELRSRGIPGQYPLLRMLQNILGFCDAHSQLYEFGEYIWILGREVPLEGYSPAFFSTHGQPLAPSPGIGVPVVFTPLFEQAIGGLGSWLAR